MSGEQMERKYLYALIFVAFIGGFAAGAITMKVAHVQPISRFTPIGNSGFEAFDTVTGRECISASEEEVFVRLKNERIANGTEPASATKEDVAGSILARMQEQEGWSSGPSAYHGMPYCSALAK